MSSPLTASPPALSIVVRRRLFSEEIVGTLDMLLHLADLNAAEVKYRDKTRGPVGSRVVTAAMIEKQEWDAFRAKLGHRKKFLTQSKNGSAAVDPSVMFEEGASLDIDEDDIDQLIQLANVFDEHYEAQRERVGRGGAGLGLTLAEIVRALQRAGVLSTEFTAAAREQTKRLLRKLREMNRVWVDEAGRWSLL